MNEGYYVEWNGDCWQSVFPTSLAECSQLHSTVDDACLYMRSVVDGLDEITVRFPEEGETNE